MTKPSAARSSSCFFRFGITSANGVARRRRRAPCRPGPSRRPCARTSSAVRQSSAARPWRSSTPCALYSRRRADAHPRRSRLRSATSSSRVAAPLPPPAHVAALARDRLGQQARRPGAQPACSSAATWTPEPVGELEVVERHRRSTGPRAGPRDTPGRSRTRLVEVVPDDHALRTADARRRCAPSRRTRPAPAGAGNGPAGAGRRTCQRASCSASTSAPSKNGASSSDTRAAARAGLLDGVEHLVRLDLDGHVALAETHQQVGLADSMRVVVDREATARDDPGAAGRAPGGCGTPGRRGRPPRPRRRRPARRRGRRWSRPRARRRPGTASGGRADRAGARTAAGRRAGPARGTPWRRRRSSA